jgi:hypothetical protein
MTHGGLPFCALASVVRDDVKEEASGVPSQNELKSQRIAGRVQIPNGQVFEREFGN